MRVFFIWLRSHDAYFIRIMIQINQHSRRQADIPSLDPRSWLFFVVLSMTVVLGCNQRTVAPELDYDPAQVEALQNEIDSLDWE